MVDDASSTLPSVGKTLAERLNSVDLPPDESITRSQSRDVVNSLKDCIEVFDIGPVQFTTYIAVS